LLHFILSMAQLLKAAGVLKRKRSDYNVSVATEAFFEWRSDPVISVIKENHLKKCVNSFYELECAAPKGPQGRAGRYICARSSLYTAVKKCEMYEDLSEAEVKDFNIQGRGRPQTLSEEQEELIIAACRQFEMEFESITMHVLSNEARFMALMRRDDEELNNDATWAQRACLRFMRVGGKKWVRGFMNRHPEISVSKQRRPVERERAAKTQPEVSLQHFRNVLHGTALCQIQRAITNGIVVPGWALCPAEGLVTRVEGGGRDPGDDVVEVRIINEKPVIFLKPLGVPLESLAPHLVVAVDEKPILPDCPVKEKMSALGVRHSIGCSRSSTWTITPVITAAGSLLLTQLIIRSGSIGTGTVLKVVKELMITRTEKGVQSDSTFVDFAKAWMPLVGATLENPGIVVVDGHSSHLTRSFTKLAAQNFLYVICEPSNLSILLQAGDNGVNATIGRGYAREYTTMFSLLSGAITIDHRIEAIWRVMKRIAEKKDLIKHSFKTVALTGNIHDCVGFWKPSHFAIGRQYRHKDLPMVSQPLLDAIFSLPQLVRPWGSSIMLPSSLQNHIPVALREKFVNWLIDASEEQAIKVGDSFTAYQMRRCEKGDKDIAVRLWGPHLEEYVEDDRSPNKNFRGRVYITEGRCLFGDSACDEANGSEIKAVESEEQRKIREKNKDEKMNHERPIVDLFLKLGFLKEEKIPTVPVLKSFAELNNHLVWPTPFPAKKKRQEQVQAILDLLATTESSTTFNGLI
jgi:hypothetical protein